MSEQLKNILWMAEELDFELTPASAVEAGETIRAFLESAAAPGLAHSVYPACR